jgi:hypothetical protein
MNYTMTAPCPKCPFRTDVEPFLRRERAEEIADVLVRQQGHFQCHATVDYSDPDDEGHGRADTRNAQHCAGALIMLERMGRPNQMMRIAERLGMYDRTRLDMAAPVFASARVFVAAHRTRRARRLTGQ